jgi:Flp pilus assembly protein TadD
VLALSELGRHEEARALAQRGLASHPDSVRLHCILALVMIDLEDPGGGLKLADDAVALDPDSGWAHQVRAWCLMGLERKKPAIAAAREAVRLEPTDPDAVYGLGSALLFGDKVKAAEQECLRLLDVAPDEARSHNLDARIRLRRRRWRDAEAASRRALEIDPQDEEALNLLEVAVGRQGRSFEAVEFSERQFQINPGDDENRQRLIIRSRRFAPSGCFIVFVTMLAVGLMGYLGRNEIVTNPLILVSGVALDAVAAIVFVVVRISSLPALARSVRVDQLKRKTRTGVDNLKRAAMWSVAVFATAAALLIIIEMASGRGLDSQLALDSWAAGLAAGLLTMVLATFVPVFLRWMRGDG